MVEHQHGISSFLSFGAKSVQPEILEKLLIGREKVAKTLEKKVKNIAVDGLNHHAIVVGARGTGKTHLLRILYHRAQSYIQDNKIVIAYFAEEEYGIAGYLDFMVRILHAFIRWNEEDADFLNEQLTILQETPSSYQEETIERIIKSYLDGRPLLILAENFNDILETLKKGGQDKLRAWLYRNDRTSIIATAQALSDDIGREDRPFYGFFEEIHLQQLTFDESYELLKSLAKIEKREDVLEHLNTKGLAQVKAIHRLVKGNHRLLVTFYEFLKADLLSDLSVTFIKTLNDLKPYYETYIRYLPPQQQKILRFIAMAKIPQLGKEIARQCFIDQKSLSKQLSELTKKKLIEAIVDETDKRNKLYDISEPLLRLSIEIGEHKEGVNALFIDFLALYYENEELEAQKNRFSEMLSKCLNDSDMRKYQYEIDARERAIKIKENFINEPGTVDEFEQQIESLHQEEKHKKVFELIEQIPPKNRSNKIWIRLAVTLFKLKKYQESLDVYKEIEPKNINNDVFYDLWGVSLGYYAEEKNDENLYRSAIKKFEIAHKINPKNMAYLFNCGETLRILAERKDNDEQLLKSAIEKFKTVSQVEKKEATIFYKLGNLFQILGDKNNDKALLKSSIEEYKVADKLNPNHEHIIHNWGRAILKLAQITSNKKILIDAVEKFKKLININPENPEGFFGLGTSYLGMTISNNDRTKLEKSIEMYFKYISLIKKLDSTKILQIINIIFLMISSDKILTIKTCQELEKIIKIRFNLPSELKISYQYLQTYRKVILQGEKQALYELPKEQREFFEEKILAKHKKS